MAHIYGIDEAAQKLVAKASSIKNDVLATYAADVDAKARFPTESVKALADAGLLGLCVPTALGGLGQAPRTFAAVTEELAQGCASTAMVFVMHVSAQQAIGASKQLTSRDELLKQIAAGKHLSTLALSEKGSRSQFWAPVSKLEAKGDGYVTNGFKSFVTSASHADSYVSSAQKPGAASPLESTLYLVRKGAPGVRTSAGFDGLGLRGNESSPVSLEGFQFSKNDLITEPGAGATSMLEVILPWFAAGSAAMANGLCVLSVGATSKHLSGTNFEHSQSALRDLPTLRARIAQMSVRTEQSRALLGYTVGEMEKPNPMTPLYVLESRCAALQAAWDVTDLAMQACGGAAFSKQLPLERAFRDSRAGWVMAPTVDHLLEFTGRALTGLPLF